MGEERHALLSGRRILVVEDDYLLAYALQRGLEDLGAIVAGPVADVQGALRLLAAEPALDAGFLDINLGGEMVYPVADAMRARGIPFAFVSGYEAWSIPSPYADVPRGEKTEDIRHLARVLFGK